ncbi:MAG TPA: hypothetical protein VFS21_14700 [Roseiflexaceae bacterium]|nr:hypothetical protein [Roseiflexaceae bacterium]
MSSYSDLVPPESRELHALVYIVEVGLRELCIDLLGQRYGPRFWREALPAELVDRMRAGVARERAAGWVHAAPRHPLYELGLPDLLALLDTDALWMAVFRYHFRLRGTVTRWLGELVVARAILHANQPVGDHQLNAGRMAYYELETAMGGAALRWRLAHPTTAGDRWALLDALEDEFDEQERRWRAGAAPIPMSAWARVADAWWFDEAFLGASVAVLGAYGAALADYARLHAAGPDAVAACAWSEQAGLPALATDAFAELYVVRAALGDQ